MSNLRSNVFTSADIVPPESKMQKFWRMLLSEDGACKQWFNGLFDLSNVSRLTVDSTDRVSQSTGFRALLPKYFGVFGLIYLLRVIYDFASILYETLNPKNLQDLEEKSFFARFKENLRSNEKRASRMARDLFTGLLNLICFIIDPVVALGLSIVGIVVHAGFELYAYLRDEKHFKELERQEALQKSLIEERSKIANALEAIKEKTRILKAEAKKHLDELNNHLEALKQKKVSLPENCKGSDADYADKNAIKKAIVEIKNEIQVFNHNHEKALAELKQNKFSVMAQLKIKDNEVERNKQSIESIRNTNHLPKRENKIAKKHLASLGIMLLFSVGGIMMLFPPTHVVGVVMLSASIAFSAGKILSGVWDFVANHATKGKQKHAEKIEIEKFSTDAKLQVKMNKGHQLEVEGQKLAQKPEQQDDEPKLERLSDEKGVDIINQQAQKTGDGLTMFQSQSKKHVNCNDIKNDVDAEDSLAVEKTLRAG